MRVLKNMVHFFCVFIESREIEREREKDREKMQVRSVVVILFLSVMMPSLSKKHAVRNHCEMGTSSTEACTCYGRVVGVCTSSEVCTEDGCKSSTRFLEAKKHTVKNHCEMGKSSTEACTCYGRVVGVCTSSEVCTEDGCKSSTPSEVVRVADNQNARFRRKD